MALHANLTAIQLDSVRKALLIMTFSKLAYARAGTEGALEKGVGNQLRFLEATLPALGTPVALGEGENPAETALTINQYLLAPDWYGAWMWLTRKLEALSIIDLAPRVSELFYIRAAEISDVIARDVVVGGTTVQFASTATARTGLTTAMVLKVTELAEAFSTLSANKAMKFPGLGRYLVIGHPHGFYDLRLDGDFKNIMLYAAERGPSNPWFEGEAFQTDLMDARIFITDLATKWVDGGASSADAYSCMVIAYQAFGFGGVTGEMAKTVPGGTSENVPRTVDIIQKSPEIIGGPLSVRGSLGFIETAGAVRLNENYMVRIEHGATQGA